METHKERKGPLAGIKVIDLTHAVAGPSCSLLLADMGADVIKIERVQGEPARLGLPVGMEDLVEAKAKPAYDSALWMANNRNKRSLALDIRQAQGKEIALSQEKIKKWIGDKEIKKTIFVPGKLINFVVEEH